MFCSNCGMEIENNIKFCPNCGANIEGFQKSVGQSVEYQPQPVQQADPYAPAQPLYQQPIVQYHAPQAYLPNKSEVVAMLLSWFVLPGLGQIYVGKTNRGIGFLIGQAAGGVIIGVTAFWLIWYVFPLFIILILGLVGIQIWNIVDAYVVAGRYNKFVARTGRAPQPGDVW